MEINLFIEENRQEEKDFLARYNLDVNLFEKMGLKIKQIIPAKTVYHIITDKGFYCLRRLRFSMEETQLILDFTDYLKANGFPNRFDVIRKEDGSIFVDYDEDKYFLTQWMDGRESDPLNPLDINAAAEALALLHEAAKGFKPKTLPKERDLLGKWPTGFRSKIKEIKAMKQEAKSKKDKSHIDKLYLTYTDTCLQEAEAALQALLQTSYAEQVKKAKKQGSFIHRDFSHHSLLHTFDGKTYITDFDACAADLRIHDIAGFIFRNMRRSNWDIEKAFSILDAYNKKSPIEKEELSLLKIFLTFPQDFQSASRQYIEKKNWEEQEFIDRINVESEYTASRRKFLEALETRL